MSSHLPTESVSFSEAYFSEARAVFAAIEQNYEEVGIEIAESEEEDEGLNGCQCPLVCWRKYGRKAFLSVS